MKNFKLITSLPFLLALSALPLTAADGQEALFSQAELDQMLAPVALYPDVLLSQVLMAATYPLEVVEAARWTRANPDLEGEYAVNAVAEMDWDESVITLVGFPDLIQRMDENLQWTRRLGDAFLLQEEQVMDTIQSLRHRALESGNLESLTHLRVERKEQVVVIEPADVRVVYVPYYSTRVVYGDWWWHGYPPVYWMPPPGYYTHLGFYWSRGFRVSTGFYFSTFDWHRRSIVVVTTNRGPKYDYRHTIIHRRHSADVVHWRHNPRHRRGVDYRGEVLSHRYDRHSASGVRTSRTLPRERPQSRESVAVRGDGSNRTESPARRSSLAQTGRIARTDGAEQTTRSERTNRPDQRVLPERTNRTEQARPQVPRVAESTRVTRPTPPPRSEAILRTPRPDPRPATERPQPQPLPATGAPPTGAERNISRPDRAGEVQRSTTSRLSGSRSNLSPDPDPDRNRSGRIESRRQIR